ncbi:MAG: lipopolysaccharide heptosyltransferase II [Pseudomonadota bacterium]
MSALVVAPAWIGDAVLAQVLFMRLQAQAAGRLQLDVLAPSWVAPVLARMPQVRHVIVNPFGHGVLALAERYRFARQLRAADYDCAYVLPNSFKSALIPYFAGIPLRVGFTGEARYALLNRRHRLDKTALPTMAERFAQLAEPFSAMPSALTGQAQGLPVPRLSSSPAQQQAVLDDLQLVPTKPCVVLCPGAEYGEAKRWPAAHFAALADLLVQRGDSVWLLGSAKDGVLGEAICALVKSPQQVHNLCGRTTLTQAIDLIAQAKAVICNDSGLMHVAAALARPLLAIYGSSSPVFTPPLSEHARIISLHLDCSPCFKRVCPLGHLNCLKQLDAQRVFQALLDYEKEVVA